ncbi:MAG: pyridoxamine 5'-phosphate oxidase family protein [Gammaproteobacteria bacterium]|nr:pyridoxamine 5'-phosphate oxidase family protein [Gammaproteobacteria bacterium]
MDKWVCQLLDSEPRGFLASSYRNSPHVVPVVFVRLHDRIYSPIDAKPKATHRLRRVRNIEHNNAVSFMLDNYDADWQKLWWLRLDGLASIGPLSNAIAELLVCKYPQYRSMDVGSTAIELSEIRWRYWSMDGSRPLAN